MTMSTPPPPIPIPHAPSPRCQAEKEFGIDYFLVWHAITGYWAGVDLDSPELLKYKPRRAVLNAPPGTLACEPCAVQ